MCTLSRSNRLQRWAFNPGAIRSYYFWCFVSHMSTFLLYRLIMSGIYSKANQSLQRKSFCYVQTQEVMHSRPRRRYFVQKVTILQQFVVHKRQQNIPLSFFQRIPDTMEFLVPRKIQSSSDLMERNDVDDWGYYCSSLCAIRQGGSQWRPAV